MEILETISKYCGSISAIIALCVLIIKPLRTKFISWITKTSDTEGIHEKLNNLTTLVEQSIQQNHEMKAELAMQSESLMVSLRNSILAIYTTRMSRGYMTEWENMNLSSLYSQYKKLGGNSYVHECVERLRRLPVRDEYNTNINEATVHFPNNTEN